MQADAIRAVTGVIRKFQPDVVFAPFHEDRHPDHGNCGRLTEEAFFRPASGNTVLNRIFLPINRNIFIFIW